MAHLKNGGVQASFHYVPLHPSPMGRGLGAPGVSLPVTEDLSARVPRLLFHTTLTEAEQAIVVAEISRCFRNKRLSEVRHTASPEAL